MSHPDRESARSPTRHHWVRRIVRALATLAVGLVLLIGALLLALQLPAARQALLHWASNVVASSTGVEATAGDFTLALWRGQLTIDDLTLRAAPDAPPFLTVHRARAVVSWGSLFGDRTVIRSIFLEGPRADLGAPLPELSREPDPEEEASPPAVDVEEILLTGGSFDSGPLPEDFEIWLDAASAEDIEIEGSYRDDTLSLRLPSARITASSGRRPPIEATLETGLDLDAEQLSVKGLKLEGDGLSLNAEGQAELTDARAAEVSFALDAEPALLLPDLTSSGRLDGTGELDVTGDRLVASVRLDARELPAEVLRPWVSAEQLELEGTSLDVEADLVGEVALSSRDDPLDGLTGHADLVWRRDDERLVTATLRSEDGDDSAGIRLAFSAEALPAEAGTRRLTGALRARRWLALDEGELVATRFDLEVPNLQAATRRLGLPESFDDFRPAGEVKAMARITGPILQPVFDAEADWRVDGDDLASLRARTLGSVASQGPLRLEFDASLLPSSPGRRRLAGIARVDDLRQAADGELGGSRFEDLRVTMISPDLATTVREFRGPWQTLFPNLELPAPLAEGSSLATGALKLYATGAGPVRGPRLDVNADWRPAPGEQVHLELDGDAALTAPFIAGRARLRTTDLDVRRLAGSSDESGLEGRMSAALDVDGSLDVHQATLVAEITDLRSGDGIGVEHLTLTARSDDSLVTFDSLNGTLDTGQPLSGQGWARLELLSEPRGVSAGELQLELPRPIETLARLVAALELADGTVTAELAIDPAGALGLEPQPVALVRTPLAALTAGTGEAHVAISGLELEPFLPLFELAEDTPRPSARFDGSFTVDLDDPIASTGTIEISGVAVQGPHDRVKAVEDLRLALRDRRLELLPGRILGAGGGTLEMHGHLELAPDWRPGDDPAGLASTIELDLDGRFETSVLNPLLAGTRASGELHVTLDVRGPPAAPTVEGRLDGSKVELFHATPYVTRIEAPTVDLKATAGGTSFTARTRLNGGNVTASGSLDRDHGLALTADFSGVRYRVDYGLTTRVAGDLKLTRPAGGPRSLLTGAVLVERGSLRNDVILDRETLALLLAPDMTSTEDASANDLVDLDLTVTTAHGISIKNNIGELRADWSQLRVRGTLQNPVLDGRIDVDPGGTLTAYGQILRIDQASIDFAGDSTAPRVVFETTSSLEDPSIKQDRRRFSSTGLGDEGPGSGGFWSRRGSGNEVDAGRELTSGLIDHLTNHAAGSLTRGLARTEISLEPLQIFGETDTNARLTATQQISDEAQLIYSVNPRDAEGQTYILELHEADLAPSLTAQIFTNDDDNAGVTLQQTLQLGAGRRSGLQGRRFGGMRVHAPPEIDARRLKRALGLRKNDPFPDDAEFDVEVDAIAVLRDLGYPGARVRVGVESPALPSERTLVRPVLDVTVDPGPRVRFVFDGTKPPGPARRSIVQSYRPAVEELSLEDLHASTVKALRSEGYLEPTVEVTIEPAGDLEDAKLVRITAEGGRRVTLRAPRFEGLTPEVTGRLLEEFDSQLSRVELAVGVPGADRYLRQLLAAEGYPEAAISSRHLSEDGATLTIGVAPGVRQHLARIEILGLPAEDETRLLESLPVQPGDPMRSGLITRAAHAIEDMLRQRGHAEAAVRTSLEPTVLEPAAAASPADTTSSLRLLFEVDAGPIHRIAGVRLEGLDSTRQAWATRLAGLEPGTTFRDDDVGRARRRLMGTGLFESVLTHTEQTEGDPTAPERSPTTGTEVVFDLDEKSRYLLSYGGRWESGENPGVVVDAVDLNFLGRGTTLGVRAIYAGDDDRSLRFYHAIPRVVGSKSSLELFLEGKNQELGGLLASGVEFWTQLTFPLSRRSRNRFYFRYQDLALEESSDEAGSEVEPEIVRTSLRIPSVGWQISIDTRDRALGARRPDGLFASLDLVASHGDVSGDSSAEVSTLGVFSQLKLFTSLAERPTGGHVTWAQSLRVGYQEAFEDAEIPTASRLRAGGEYSVRGYERDRLGPLDADNEALGGDLLLIVNQELRFPLYGGWLRGLVFLDAGNVWTSRDTLDSEIFTSVGAGLRAATPAGPLRLDVAVPLDRRSGVDDSYKVYVGFGHVF